MSRYRSVPVNTSTDGRPGSACVKAASAAAARRACRAISRSGARQAGRPVVHDGDVVARAQEVRPAAGGLPVAVVFPRRSGADDQYAFQCHRRPLRNSLQSGHEFNQCIFRTARPQQLAEALQAARNYTLGLFDCLAAAGLDALARVPHIATINPPLWELGHIAWFAEWFILREALVDPPGGGAAPFAADARRRLVRLEHWCRTARAGRWTCRRPARSRPTATKCWTARSTSSRAKRHRRSAVSVPAGAGARRHARRGAAVHAADAGRAGAAAADARRGVEFAIVRDRLPRRHHRAGRRAGGRLRVRQREAAACRATWRRSASMPAW